MDPCADSLGSGKAKRAGYHWALKKESQMLQQLTEPDAAGFEELHIVKLYKSFHTAPGTGTNQKWDTTPWDKLDDGGDKYNEDQEVGR
jgi:hypothetical protein